MLSHRKYRSQRQVRIEKTLEVCGTSDVFVKGDPNVSKIVHIRDSFIGYDYFRFQLCMLLERQKSAKQFVCIRRWQELSFHNFVVLLQCQRAADLVGHTLFFFLALQSDAALGSIVDPNPKFFPGIGAIFIFVKLPVLTVIEIYAANLVSSVRTDVGIWLAEHLDP